MTRLGVGLDSIATSLLVLWLGAALFFALAVAPSAFAVLPEAALAGALIGRLLPPLFVGGAFLGLLIVIMELQRRGSRRRWRASAAGVMLTACALAQVVVGGRIDRLRTEIGRPIAALERDDPRRVAFGRLHALSVVALGAAMIAAATAVLAPQMSAAARS
jgi:Domain of unknown function (DUF4149)